MFAVKAKIYDLLYNPASSIDFDETSSYWSAPNSFFVDCTAHQCLPLRRKFMVCSIIQLARSILMKHLVIGQRQKASNFSAFHWSLHG